MEIKISGKYIMLIDDCEYPKVAGFNLHVSTRGYAEIRYFVDGKMKSVSVHRLLMSAKPEETIDHMNGNKLDNRLCNLRSVTKNQNMQNCKTYKSSSTGFKGVSWHKSAKKYIARIQVNKTRLIIGYYDFLEDAVLARKEASRKYHGEYSGLLSR